MSRHRVLGVKELVAGTCLIRFTREDLVFEAGQYLYVGVPGGDVREYSIFSRPADAWLEILVRVIPEGAVSPRLATLQPDDVLEVQGPLGGFCIPAVASKRPHLLVATGTGIAPYHSITGAYPQLDYMLYHGVRYAEEQYASRDFPVGRYIPCLSRGIGGGHARRVTDVVRTVAIAPETACYLCGSCDMIYDMFALLQQKSIPRDQIHAETYY